MYLQVKLIESMFRYDRAVKYPPPIIPQSSPNHPPIIPRSSGVIRDFCAATRHSLSRLSSVHIYLLICNIIPSGEFSMHGFDVQCLSSFSPHDWLKMAYPTITN